jgi:hypothetical protein
VPSPGELGATASPALRWFPEGSVAVGTCVQAVVGECVVHSEGASDNDPTHAYARSGCSRQKSTRTISPAPSGGRPTPAVRSNQPWLLSASFE